MRKKLEQFHQKIRQDDINRIKENIRDTLIQAIARDERID